jgi:sigma-54 dependent transcriptional regulator, acetoin dehydrogenase operon transcriptional activator AcoR
VADDSSVGGADATLATGGPDVPADEGARPALINAGHADAGGRSEGGRLFFIADGLELGRRPSLPAGGGTWYIPDGRVSSRHARISRLGKTLHIVDLDSRNGTLVNGRRIDGPTRLVEGDVIMVGRQAAVFRWLTGEQARAITQELQQPFGPTRAIAPAMALLLQRLRLLAPSQEELLLTGETGVGKEVYAQAVHHASGRKGPFVAVNCAALPVELVESELFGFVRGAHSQASESRAGLLARAEGGTLFLDEIGDMPPAAQAKLLRFLQTRSYQPLGAGTLRTLDVRVLAATTLVVQDDRGRGLRPDLAGRLGAEPLVIPPLRRRPEDLGALVAHFLAGPAGKAAPAPPRRLEAAAFAALLAHSWPQNVRELEKVVRQAVLFAEAGDVIRAEHLPLRLRPGGALAAEAQPSGSTETAGIRRRRRPMPDREALVQLLEQYRGNVAEVARHLDRHWGVVQRALAKHQIDAAAYRHEGD